MFYKGGTGAYPGISPSTAHGNFLRSPHQDYKPILYQGKIILVCLPQITSGPDPNTPPQYCYSMHDM